MHLIKALGGVDTQQKRKLKRFESNYIVFQICSGAFDLVASIEPYHSMNNEAIFL